MFRYDALPAELLCGERQILEVGARYGEAQLASRHRDAFLSASREGRYLGIDLLEPRTDNGLNIARRDLFDMPPAPMYDTILVLEVLEHICLRSWPDAIDRLRALLRPGGHLMVTVPYCEPLSALRQYIAEYRTEPAGGHVVLGITRDMLQLFLPDAEVTVLRRRYPFRTGNESQLWAALRLIKRTVLREHPGWWWLIHCVKGGVGE